MKRRIGNILATLSLLVCVAAAAIWVRSGWRGDLLATGSNGRHPILAQSDAGLIIVNISRAYGWPRDCRRESWQQPAAFSMWSRLGSRWWERLGFGHYVGGDAWSQRIDQFVVPYYFVVAVTAFPPAMLVVRRVRARRCVGADHCRRCGYDCRASPQRCPECGTPRA